MMVSSTPNLEAPLELGQLMLRNRTAMASLTRNRSVPTNVPNEANELYYEQRAKGGCGLLLGEGTLVYQQGTEWPHAPGIWNMEQVHAWKRVTDRVHEAGGLIFCQVWSVGRAAHPEMPEQKAAGEPVWAPSAIAARGGAFRILPNRPGYVVPTESKHPEDLIQRFIEGAKNAKLAGFDGVELHGANGYLPHAFLDSTSNKRTDKWGGSIENRARFMLLTLEGLHQVFPGRVGVKLSPCGGYNDMGMPLDETIETYSYLIKKINEIGLAYIQLVRDIPFMDPVIDGTKRGTPFDVFGTLGPMVNRGQTALFLNGDISAEEGETLLAQGVGDVIVFGRPWISNPDFAHRIFQGKVLNEASDPKYWQACKGDDPNTDYTDFSSASDTPGVSLVA